MNHDLPASVDWSFPTSIHFGVGRIRECSQHCKNLAITRPLVITDPGMARLPVIQQLEKDFRKAGLPFSLYSEIRSNPHLVDVQNGLRAFRAGNHDGVIGLGGGSALDVSKTVALMANQNRYSIWEFEDGKPLPSLDSTSQTPMIAIPSTAGTGSEVGRAAVIGDSATLSKRIIFHPTMLPDKVIADPEITVTMPPDITAAVGMDALSHNLEAFCSPVFHPMAQGIALEAIGLIKRWLLVAHQEGNNLSARSAMLAASTMGAVAFQKGLGAMHSLSHPCSALFNTHHGLTNAIVMPYVLQFNRPAIEEKITMLARCLNIDNPSFDSFLEWVLNFRKQLAIPNTLAAIGVSSGQLDQMAEMACADPSSATNPIPLTVDNLMILYQQTINGQQP